MGTMTIENYLRQSLGMTLKSKYRLVRSKAVFDRYGYDCKIGKGPRAIGFGPSIVSYKWPLATPKVGAMEYRRYLTSRMATMLSKSDLYKPCAVCQSKVNVEVHFAKALPVVNGKPSTDWWSVRTPLCSKHHAAVHAHGLRKEEYIQYSKFLERRYSKTFAKITRSHKNSTKK